MTRQLDQGYFRLAFEIRDVLKLHEVPADAEQFLLALCLAQSIREHRPSCPCAGNRATDEDLVMCLMGGALNALDALERPAHASQHGAH